MNRVSSSDETYGRSVRSHMRGTGHTRGHQQRIGRQRSHSPSTIDRSSPVSVDSHEASKTRMRWILSLGLLLPALAAIIGVVAWAVSAEVVMGTRREMARNNELHKPSSEASYWLSHNRNKHSQEHVANDRIDEPSAEKMQFLNRVKPAVIKDMKKEFKNESLASSDKVENSVTKNANIYFLAGLDSLSSSKMVNSEATNVNSKPKKSAGAQVAEVIDRIVAQRKRVGSPHIVVVAPLSDSKKKVVSTTTTTTTPAPKSYSRDADTLLAAAQLLAAQHKIKELNRMDQDRMDDDYDDSNSNSNNDDNNNNNKASFESANLLNYDSPKQSDSKFVSVPPYQPVPPPQPPSHNVHPPQSPYPAASAPHPTYVSSNRVGFDSSAHQHMQQNMHSPPHAHGPPISSPQQHYRAPPQMNQPMPPPMPAHNMHSHYPVGPIAQNYPPHAFNGGFNSAASFNAPTFSSHPFNGPQMPPNSYNKNNRALVSFQGGDVGDNSYGHGHSSELHGSFGQGHNAESHASYEEGPGKGITLHFGGGPIGGGGQVVTSPIGIFKTLLLPLLPKPRVNLNGKVVFGVVLEKGVGFGKQKQFHPIPHHYKRK